MRGWIICIKNLFTIYGMDLPALRWKANQPYPPKAKDHTMLDGGVKLGWFWSDCKHNKRGAKTPYDRLLTNPVLRADYLAAKFCGRCTRGRQPRPNEEL